jgi:hypothetical protein
VVGRLRWTRVPRGQDGGDQQRRNLLQILQRRPVRSQTWIAKALVSDDQSDLPATNCEAWESGGERRSGVATATMLSMAPAAYFMF